MARRSAILDENTAAHKDSPEATYNGRRFDGGHVHAAGAAGYAAFGNFGMKILVAGSGSGKGLAVDDKARKEAFMKMYEVEAGNDRSAEPPGADR